MNQLALIMVDCARFIHQTNTNAFHTLPGSCICACVCMIKGPGGGSCLSTVWQIQCRERGWGCCAPHPEQRLGHMMSRCLHWCRLAGKQQRGAALHITFLNFLLEIRLFHVIATNIKQKNTIQVILLFYICDNKTTVVVVSSKTE